MAISHLYWHLVVKNSYFILLLTYSVPEWQFHIATDIKWSRMSSSSWSFISIYRNERALLSKRKTWNELKSGRWTYFSWCPPPFETAWWKTDSYTFPYHQWEPIWNGQFIRKYKKIPVQWQIDRYIETNTQLDTISRWTPPVKQVEMPAIPLHQLLDLLHI